VASIPPVVGEVLATDGQPLDPGARASFEAGMGHDLAQVRVHADAEARASARAVHALAYTVGDDLVFGAGRYDPRSPRGRALLAHELTHTTRQRAMRVPVLQRAPIPDAPEDPAPEDPLELRLRSKAGVGADARLPAHPRASWGLTKRIAALRRCRRSRR
jgi:hypothetical protein